MNQRKAAEWIAAYQYCQANKSVPRVLAQAAAQKYPKALSAAMDKPKRIAPRIPKSERAKTPAAIKKGIRSELEALCKAIVFTRDCGDPDKREGSCISCGRWNPKLQWGHFIRQQDSKWLQYDPRNTAGQCANCNGFRAGNVLEFAKAIDRRDGDGAANALQKESEEKDKWWRPTKRNLEQKLAELRAHPLAPTPTDSRPE